ncbi:MAG: hypothetical protein C0391_00060 [Anaerolinea sp.]|nr:hypothetical protein [Anaerolinea sp.]
MHNVTKHELNFISQDIRSIIQIVLGNKENPKMGVIGLGLPPFIALVVEGCNNYETADKQQKIFGQFENPLFEKYAKTIRKLRVREKILDDNRGGLDALNDTLAIVNKKSLESFLSPHRGFFGRFIRLLQPDLGIFYFEDHLISTTHTAILTVGLTDEQIVALKPLEMMEVLKNHSKEFSVMTGEYLGELAKFLSERGYWTEPSTLPMAKENFQLISYNDYYAALVYKNIIDHLELSQPMLAPTIIFLLTQVNFVDKILTKLLPITSNFLLRSSFMAAFHATSSLKQLKERNNINESSKFIEMIELIINSSDSNFILRASNVRNILAHYELRRASQFLTNSGDPLDDVLVGLCGKSHEEILEIAIRQLHNISEIFGAEISKTKLRKSRALFG